MILNTIDEAIEILQALKEGKEIEFYSRLNGAWKARTCGYLLNFQDHTYRVKPAPTHDWVVEYVRPQLPGRVWGVYELLYSKTEKEVNSYIVRQSKGYPWEYRYRKVEAVS